ncbi:hypothetical protein [Streptomyces sp. NPDC017940]|uniref:hypothetical protein n=1 Tax=Streptomyces sp. NPDC017940 TaxID=3365017 RepID=UPI00378AD90C
MPEILADADYQDLGAQSGGRVVPPPHRKFKQNAPDRYEELYERQHQAHPSRRIRVERGIARPAALTRTRIRARAVCQIALDAAHRHPQVPHQLIPLRPPGRGDR